MNRRHWFQLTGAAALGCSSQVGLAKESTGRWSEEGKIRSSKNLLVWLQQNFEKRAETLELHTGNPCELEFDYLKVEDDRSKKWLFEKFEEDRLSNRAANEHIEKCLVEYERVRLQLEALEKVAAVDWKPKSKATEIEKGHIYGTGIEAGSLAVILDASRSMTPYTILPVKSR